MIETLFQAKDRRWEEAAKAVANSERKGHFSDEKQSFLEGTVKN